MANLVALLNYFRLNNIVALSDIKKAFLMIKLKLQEDKYVFSYFIIKENLKLTDIPQLFLALLVHLSF